MKKQYQNIGALLVNLRKNKNVLDSSIDYKCFNEKTYLDLVTPYSDLIAIGRTEKGKHIYPKEVDFSDYVELNKIDYSICNYLHVLIGCFEKMIKNFLMHKYCLKMKENGDKQTKNFGWVNSYCSGEQAFDLLKINEVFQEGMVEEADHATIDRRKKVLKHIANLLGSDSKNSMVEHYKEKYGYIPMFVAIHSLTLGQLLTLFGMLPQSDKNELVCIFSGTTDKRYSDSHIEKFEKDMIRIQVIRNIINHYEPIFPLLENTESAMFGSLADLFEKLNRYYKSSHSFPIYSFDIEKKCRSRSPYSLPFHLKIEKVIAVLKQ